MQGVPSVPINSYDTVSSRCIVIDFLLSSAMETVASFVPIYFYFRFFGVLRENAPENILLGVCDESKTTLQTRSNREAFLWLTSFLFLCCCAAKPFCQVSQRSASLSDLIRHFLVKTAIGTAPQCAFCSRESQNRSSTTQTSSVQ